MHVISRLRRGLLPVLLLSFAACGDSPVEELPPPSITLTAPTRTVEAGGTLQLSAAVTEEDGSASTRTVRWESNAPGVATVSSTGRVSGVAAGTATITAGVGGATSSWAMTVVRAPNPGGPQSTFLSFNSTPGDYIGGGQAVRYSVTPGRWTTQVSADRREVTVDYNGLGNWTLIFAAPQGQALKEGTYTAATRFPFQPPASPGLAFYGNSRGCNTLTGHFTIHDIAFDHEGKLHRIHATFRQHCEGGPSYLDGEIAVLNNPLR